MPAATFGPELFAFLRALKRHNDREWFAANKERYERNLRDPLLRFIAEVAKPLNRISPTIVADPRPVGGSLFRIYRDTRFSADKTPYKTHAAAQFRHRAGKDVHAPGFYLHLAPGEVFAAGGVWRPDPATLHAIRAAIAADAARWTRAIGGARFKETCRLEGEASTRVPRGFDPAHRHVEDLKRKDFIAVTHWDETATTRDDFMDRFVGFCRTAAPFMAFIAAATGREW
jgi:uncharacterized protein (TIGR02453 family)